MFITPCEFEEKTIPITNIFLDPNNPRFSDEKTVLIREADYLKPQVQSEAYGRIKAYGLNELVDSIINVGFVRIDRVVVKPILSQEDKYVVVEGNRRVAALHTIINSYERGELPELSDEVLSTIKEIEALVYNGKDEDIAWLIQGLRHISGVRNWKPFQQASLLLKLVTERDILLIDAAKSLGIGNRKASRLIKAYYGYKQAESDEDYGPYIKPDHFAYFNEVVFQRVALQRWLEWSDEEEVFEQTENLSMMLSWYVKTDDNDEEEVKLKVNSAQDMRDIVVKALIEEPDLFRKFTLDENMTVETLRTELVKRDRTDEEEWYEKLENFSNDLEDLPTIKMMPRKAEFKTLLEKLYDLIDSHIKLLK